MSPGVSIRTSFPRVSHDAEILRGSELRCDDVCATRNGRRRV